MKLFKINNSVSLSLVLNVIIFFSVFMAFSVVAQNADKIPESESISSLSVGLTVLNQYPIGEYFEVQKAVLGGV